MSSDPLLCHHSTHSVLARWAREYTRLVSEVIFIGFWEWNTLTIFGFWKMETPDIMYW